MRGIEPRAALAMIDAARPDARRQLVVNSLKRQGLSVLGPDLNRSSWEWSGEEGIRAGLSQLKGLSRAEGDVLLLEREERPFRDLAELIRRLHPSPELFSLLVRSGAVDSLLGSLSRPAALWMRFHLERLAAEGLPGELFPLEPPACLAEFSRSTRLRDERLSLGLLLSCHPIEAALPRAERLISLRGLPRRVDSRSIGAQGCLEASWACSVAGFSPAGRLLAEDAYSEGELFAEGAASKRLARLAPQLGLPLLAVGSPLWPASQAPSEGVGSPTGGVWRVSALYSLT